ncbi:MAG: hypothetical protein HUJ56_11105 [Erysipelotrichaceae bacterium]|nr:hypothetical protein [Erysipelotrichaceae bacterium]
MVHIAKVFNSIPRLEEIYSNFDITLKKELMIAALLHDFGKPFVGSMHAARSAEILTELFPDMEN